MIQSEKSCRHTVQIFLCVCVLVCVLTDPDSSCRVILITEEPQCLAAHWRAARAAAGSPRCFLLFVLFFFLHDSLLKLMRFSSQLSRNSTWTIGEQQKAGTVEKTACLWADSWLSVRLSETDLEDEGCGEVHCEGEEQREYILPYTSSSRSVFVPFWFCISFSSRSLPLTLPWILRTVKFCNEQRCAGSLSESAAYPSDDDRLWLPL